MHVCTTECLNIHKSIKYWVSLEQLFLSCSLALLPWTPGILTICLIQTHPLLHFTLWTFMAASRANNLFSTRSLMTPLQHNPEFAPGQNTNYYVTNGRRSPPKWATFLIMPPSKISGSEDAPRISLWSYLQILHFCNFGPLKRPYSREETSFQFLCTATTPKTHLISILYSTLASLMPSPLMQD